MNQRPLSPHLGVYKFMYTMSLSIMHRLTGLAASVGFLAFVWWLMALASGPGAYEGPERTSISRSTSDTREAPERARLSSSSARRQRSTWRTPSSPARPSP